MKLFSLKSLVCFACFITMTNSGFARESDDIILSKANFILEVAYNIYYEETSNTDTYEIGIYGRDSESKAVFNKLNRLVENLTIDDKPISIKLFKNIRSVLPVDVIYISGNTKVRLGDLHDKLSVNHYSMITENYPFGSSAINFSLDKNDEIVYEIQEATLRNNGAELRRRILKNRQRIASASEWKAVMEGGKKSEKRYSSSQMSTDENEEITDSLVEIEEKEPCPEIVSANKACDCQSEVDAAVKSANKKFNWLLIFTLLVVAGSTFYILRLRRQ